MVSPNRVRLPDQRAPAKASPVAVPPSSRQALVSPPGLSSSRSRSDHSATAEPAEPAEPAGETGLPEEEGYKKNETQGLDQLIQGGEGQTAPDSEATGQQPSFGGQTNPN